MTESNPQTTEATPKADPSSSPKMKPPLFGVTRTSDLIIPSVQERADKARGK